ncbi:MAG: hypothetical protein SOW18_02105 [Peptoniphilus sp.]|nr:hypothetical protein [Peptoniphilus sp.]MDY3118312.1 hypothetical protein [Peptoniphilus sp.]
MLFYIPAFIYLLYRFYKKHDQLNAVLLALCLISAMSYLGLPERFIHPIPYVFPIITFGLLLIFIYLTRREYKNAKGNYLKERRKLRENETEKGDFPDKGERIVIKDSKTLEEKIIYVKREGDQNVPHGTNEEEKKEQKIEK